MSLISDEDKAALKEIFSKKLQNKVKLVAFTKKEGCEYCEELKQLAQEVSSVDERISYEVHDFDEEAERAKYYVEMAPAITVVGSEPKRFHYYGLPAGYEFSAFIDDIIDVSRGTTRLAPATLNKLNSIDRDVRIQVFVTPSCPYCPRAVRIAHQFAMASEKFTGDMVEALEFEELAEEYGVMSVPHIVINGEYTFIGAVPETQFLNYVLEALEGKGGEGPVQAGEVSGV